MYRIGTFQEPCWSYDRPPLYDSSITCILICSQSSALARLRRAPVAEHLQFSSVQFSSVQDGIYTPGKAPMRNKVISLFPRSLSLSLAPHPPQGPLLSVCAHRLHLSFSRDDDTSHHGNCYRVYLLVSVSIFNTFSLTGHCPTHALPDTDTRTVRLRQ